MFSKCGRQPPGINVDESLAPVRHVFKLGLILIDLVVSEDDAVSRVELISVLKLCLETSEVDVVYRADALVLELIDQFPCCFAALVADESDEQVRS